jgi:hypothetical protein
MDGARIDAPPAAARNSRRFMLAMFRLPLFFLECYSFFAPASTLSDFQKRHVEPALFRQGFVSAERAAPPPVPFEIVGER